LWVIGQKASQLAQPEVHELRDLCEIMKKQNRGDADFLNYDAPLFQQIVNRIKAKVTARLGEGVYTRDRPAYGTLVQ
jgi:hypothetical protein